MSGAQPKHSSHVARRGARHALCFSLCVHALARGQTAPVRAPGSAASPSSAVVPRADPGSLERETSAIVVADATPRSFHVVTVPIPPELQRAGTVRFDVTRTGGATVLGSTSGTLDPRAASSAVVLTIGVPAVATGGRARVAVVRLAADGYAALRVPVELDVAGIARLEITPKRPMHGAQRGDRVEVSFEIRNVGNVRDTIDVSVDAPPSWSIRFSEPPHVVLGPGESVERTIFVNVPTLSDLGDFGVALVATSRAGGRARGLATIEVTDGLGSGFQSGPVVTLGAGSTTRLGGDLRAVESVALQGPVGDALTVSGRLSAPLPSDPVASRLLAMLGYSSRSNYLTLAASGWSATLGNTGVGLPDLGGQRVFGRGGTLRLGSRSRSVALFAASPDGAGGSSWNQSSLIGASVETAIGTGALTAFLAHLRDSTYTIRALDAAGIGLDARPWNDGMLSGEVAARSYRGGGGLGAAGGLRTPVAGGQLDLQLTHAPGGSGAFALATDAFTATGARSFGRLHAELSYWTMRDENRSSDDVASIGWSVSPSYPVLPVLTLASYAQGSSYSTNGIDGGFASTQRDLGLRAVLVRGGYELTADARASAVSRAINGVSGAVVNDESRRVVDRLRLDHAGARGEFGFGGSMETNIAGEMSTPPQRTFDAYVGRLQLFPGLPHVTFTGSAQRLWFGDAALTTSRLEANLELQRSTRIVLGVERGTARDAAGLLQTVLTLKVERAARLPALGRRSMNGVVFEDRNGNGVRDPGEPGVSGIVVRRGPQSSVTDAAGVFRLDDRAPGRVEIDARSLPTGWLPSSRSIAGDGEALSFGVIPTSALDVDVKLVQVDDAAPRVRAGRGTLTLRDSTGRAWTAWTDGALHATFDALPIGRYTLTVELEETSEPLIVDRIAPIDVTGGARRRLVVVTARTRPLRMFRAEP